MNAYRVRTILRHGLASTLTRTAKTQRYYIVRVAYRVAIFMVLGNHDCERSSSGHAQVTVSEKEVKVDYVRSIVPGVTRTDLENGAVEHSYIVRPK